MRARGNSIGLHINYHFYYFNFRVFELKTKAGARVLGTALVAIRGWANRVIRYSSTGTHLKRAVHYYSLLKQKNGVPMGLGHVGGPAGQRCVEQQSDQRASLFRPSRDVTSVMM